LTLNRSIPEGIENFILLTVDCLRQLEFYGYWKTLPKFAELLKAGFMVNVDSSWNYISMIEQPLFYYQIIDRNFSIEKMWKT